MFEYKTFSELKEINKTEQNSYLKNLLKLNSIEFGLQETVFGEKTSDLHYRIERGFIEKNELNKFDKWLYKNYNKKIISKLSN